MIRLLFYADPNVSRKAVGLFNRGEMEANVVARWEDFGVSGKQAVRDLWCQKNLGAFEDQFQSAVPRHGVVLVWLSSSRR